MIFKRREKEENKKKLAIIKSLSKVRLIESKLSLLEGKLNSVIASGITRIAELKDKNLNMEAELLAAEIASKRGMLTEIMRMRTGLERLRLRLETILMVGESRENLVFTSQLLKELKSFGVGKIPEIAVMLNELEQLIGEIYGEFDTGYIYSIEGVPVVSYPEEVEKILKEADIVAQGRERKKLPLPPGS